METPLVKFEHSPADSLADSFGSPGTSYPSLFDESETMNPSDVMTPGFDDDSVFDHSTAGTPAPEKKQVKKRKSWGQQLPEPKTNLPPRKRAKTDDEKEQRRVERVLRNRRAAQSSRERKRMEVEALEGEKRQIERRAQDLEMRLAESEAQNALLHQRIAQMSAGMTVFSSPSPHAEQYKHAPSPTFSQELFSSHDAANSSATTYQPTVETPVKTVNPASLSPEMRPVPEKSNASSSDMTQHPAVSVGRAPALDLYGGDASSNSFELGAHQLSPTDFSSYFGFPEPSLGDHEFLEHGLLPLADSLAFEYDHLASHHADGSTDDYNLFDFVHPDTESAPLAPSETEPENELASTTASLQPPLGASAHGCDDGRNAVSV